MSEAQAADPIPEAPADEEVADKARALALLAREDERQTKLHDLLETIREQIRVEVAPEHRPAGLMQNIQNAVYAMRGRTALMNDAAITNALRRSTATDKPGVREAALEEAAKVAETITQDGDYDLEPEATVAASVAGKQIAATIRALSASPLTEEHPTHRHKKRGTEYVLIGYGKMQAEEWVHTHREKATDPIVTSVDMREVAIYRSAADPIEIWVRPREEFEDGRFEPLPRSTTGGAK